MFTMLRLPPTVYAGYATIIDDAAATASERERRIREMPSASFSVCYDATLRCLRLRDDASASIAR